MELSDFLKTHFGDYNFGEQDKSMILDSIHVMLNNPPRYQPFRKNGEPFYAHPLSAASTLIDLGLPAYVVCAELMHDVVEDSEFRYSLERMEHYFHLRIRQIIEGVTKLPKDQFATKVDRIMESYRRIIRMLPDYWEIIFAKLADRKHNLETLGAFEPEKQAAICVETLWCLIPIAKKIAPSYVPPEFQSALHDLTAAVEREAEERLALVTTNYCRRFLRSIAI